MGRGLVAQIQRERMPYVVESSELSDDSWREGKGLQ